MGDRQKVANVMRPPKPPPPLNLLCRWLGHRPKLAHVGNGFRTERCKRCNVLTSHKPVGRWVEGGGL